MQQDICFVDSRGRPSFTQQGDIFSGPGADVVVVVTGGGSLDGGRTAVSNGKTGRMAI